MSIISEMAWTEEPLTDLWAAKLAEWAEEFGVPEERVEEAAKQGAEGVVKLAKQDTETRPAFGSLWIINKGRDTIEVVDPNQEQAVRPGANTFLIWYRLFGRLYTVTPNAWQYYVAMGNVVPVGFDGDQVMLFSAARDDYQDALNLFPVGSKWIFWDDQDEFTITRVDSVWIYAEYSHPIGTWKDRKSEWSQSPSWFVSKMEDGFIRPVEEDSGQRKLFGRVASGLQISVVNGDITQLQVDAIVNAANAQLILGSGVAGAIRVNGGPEIQAECDQKAPIQVGEAVETTAGNLPAKYVIHAATMASGGGNTSAEIIYQATMSSLILADQLGCHSIALPAFGTGVGGFSLEECAQLMFAAVNAYSPRSLSQVIFSVWGNEAEQIFQQALNPDEKVGAADTFAVGTRWAFQVFPLQGIFKIVKAAGEYGEFIGCQWDQENKPRSIWWKSWSELNRWLDDDVIGFVEDAGQTKLFSASDDVGESADRVLEKINEMETPWQPHQPSWTPSVSEGVIRRQMQMAMYHHQCPQCRGYFRDRGGIYTCDVCGFDYNPNE